MYWEVHSVQAFRDSSRAEGLLFHQRLFAEGDNCLGLERGLVDDERAARFDEGMME